MSLLDTLPDKPERSGSLLDSLPENSPEQYPNIDQAPVARRLFDPAQKDHRQEVMGVHNPSSRVFKTPQERERAVEELADVPATVGGVLASVPVQAVAGVAGLASLVKDDLTYGGPTDRAGSLTKAARIIQRTEQAAAYQPTTTAGKATEAAITYPFRKIAEAGQYVGEQTEEATGSPTAGALADTAVNLVPFLIPFAVKGGKAGLKALTESEAYRKMTIPERGLVVQTYDDLVKTGLSEAQLAKMSPEYFKEAVKRRAQGESVLDTAFPEETANVQEAAQPEPMAGTREAAAEPQARAEGLPEPAMPAQDGRAGEELPLLQQGDIETANDPQSREGGGTEPAATKGETPTEVTGQEVPVEKTEISGQEEPADTTAVEGEGQGVLSRGPVESEPVKPVEPADVPANGAVQVQPDTALLPAARPGEGIEAGDLRDNAPGLKLEAEPVQEVQDGNSTGSVVEDGSGGKEVAKVDDLSQPGMASPGDEAGATGIKPSDEGGAVQPSTGDVATPERGDKNDPTRAVLESLSTPQKIADLRETHGKDTISRLGLKGLVTPLGDGTVGITKRGARWLKENTVEEPVSAETGITEGIEEPAPPAKTVKPAKAKTPPKVDRTKDDVAVAISKLGGLDFDEAHREWGDVVKDSRKDLASHVLRETRRFGNVFKKGGMPIDKMRESLVGHGYLTEGADLHDLYTVIEDATRGKLAKSVEATVDAEMENEAKEHEDRILAMGEAEKEAHNAILDAVEGDDTIKAGDDFFDFGYNLEGYDFESDHQADHQGSIGTSKARAEKAGDGRGEVQPAAEQTDDAGGWRQETAVKGSKKTPTIGEVQKQGGKRIDTSALMDGFTPEPAGLFDTPTITTPSKIEDTSKGEPSGPHALTLTQVEQSLVSSGFSKEDAAAVRAYLKDVDDYGRDMVKKAGGKEDPNEPVFLKPEIQEAIDTVVNDGVAQPAISQGTPKAKIEDTTLHDITSVPALALEALGKLAKTGKEALPHLEALGKSVYEEGATNYRDFISALKEQMGELWERFKGMADDVWERVKAKLKDERGAVGRDLGKREKFDLIDRHYDLIEAEDETAALSLENSPLWKSLSEEDFNDYLDLKSGVTAFSATEALERGDIAAAEEKMHRLAEAEERLTSLKNEVTAAESGPQDHWQYTRDGIIEEGKRLVDSGAYDPRRAAREIVENPHKVISHEQQAALLYDRQRIYNEYDALTENIAKAMAANDGDEINKLRQDRARMEDALQSNAQAATYLGTGWSAFGQVRQAFMDKDYSPLWLQTRAKAALGVEVLPEAVKAEMESMAAQIKKLEAEHREAVKNAEEEATRKAIERIHKEVKSKKTLERENSAEGKAVREKEFKSLSDRLKKVLDPYRLNANLDPEAVAIVLDMARLRIMDGISGAKEIVDDIYSELEGNFDVSKRDIQDAISGYGETRELSQDELNVTLREVKRQLRLFSALEDAEGGQVPLHSGMQRDPVSDEVRELTKKVKEVMRETGLDQSDRTPEDQWRTAMDTVHTRLKNQIHDLDKQIAGRKRTERPLKKLDYDDEAKALQKLRDEKKQLLAEIDPKGDNEARVNTALSALEKAIERNEKALRGEAAPEQGKGAPVSKELALRRVYNESLRQSLKEMKDSQKTPQDPEEAKLKAYKSRLLKREADLNEQIITGNFEKSARKTLKLDSEAEKLAGRVAQKKEEAESRMRQLHRQSMNKLERRIYIGGKALRFSILSGTKVLWKISVASMVTRPLQTTLEEAAGSFNLFMSKGAGSVGRHYRAIDSGAPRQGGGLNVRAEASAYVQWFRSEQYKNMWDELRQGKMGIEIQYGGKVGEHGEHHEDRRGIQSWGSSKLDHFDYIADFPGRLHGTLKAVAYTQEFYRALQIVTEHYIRNEKDMSDPINQLVVKNLAEAEANRARLMSDHVMQGAYKSVLRHIEQRGTVGGRLAGALIRANFPITKVPLNYFSESTSFLPGVGYAKAKLVLASAKLRVKDTPEGRQLAGEALFDAAMEEMTPHEKDAYIRAMKKHTVGVVAAATIGYFLYQSFGGFYRKGEKRKRGELKEGEISIGGVNFSSTWFHAPVFEAFQAWAMVHHMEDLANRKEAKAEKAARKRHEEPPDRTGKGEKMAEGALAAGLGMVERVPYVGTPIRVWDQLQSYQGGKDYLQNLALRALVPQLLVEASKNRDKVDDVVVPRKTDTISAKIMVAIPGMREKLPIDPKKLKRMDIGDLAVLAEGANQLKLDAKGKKELAKIFNLKLKHGYREIKEKDPDLAAKYLDIHRRLRE